MKSVVLGLCLSAALVSCGKKEAPKSNYREVTVQNGGTIQGVVKFEGQRPSADQVIVEKDQDVCGVSHSNPADPGPGPGVAGAVVYLENVTSGKAFAASYGGKLDQHKCEFSPHFQLLRLGSPVLVSNSDDVTHNSHFFIDGKPIENQAQPPGAPPVEVNLPETGLHLVNCDVHPWMRGFVMVIDHPYYAVTDANGAYSLTNVPPGKYTIKVWRDSWTLGQPKGPNGKITSYDWGGDYHNEATVEVQPNATATLDLPIH